MPPLAVPELIDTRPEEELEILAQELTRIEIAQEELTRRMRALSTRLSYIRTGGSGEVAVAMAER